MLQMHAQGLCGLAVGTGNNAVIQFARWIGNRSRTDLERPRLVQRGRQTIGATPDETAGHVWPDAANGLREAGYRLCDTLNLCVSAQSGHQLSRRFHQPVVQAQQPALNGVPQHGVVSLKQGAAELGRCVRRS